MLSGLPRRRIAKGLCAVPLFVAPLLGGTAARPHTLWIAALCGILGLAVGLGAWRSGRRLQVSFFGAFLGLALFLTLAQLIPLPAAVRAALCPGSDAALRLITADLGGYPQQAHALSVDPSATANEAVRLGSYLLFLWTLSLAFSQHGDGARLVRLLPLSAGLLSLVGLLIALGVPVPPPLLIEGAGITRARIAAGFVNSNHLAAFLAIGAIISAGAALSRKRPAPPLLLQGLAILLLILLNIALLLTLSRGGIAVGLSGQVLLALLLWHRAGRTEGQARPRLLFALVPLLLAIVALLLFREARDDLAARLQSTRLQQIALSGSKLHAWVEALPLLRGHLLFGVGRGAFDAAFQAHSSLGGSTRFVYLENEWLQTVVDFGVPASLALFALLALALRGAVYRLRDAERQGRKTAHRLAALIALLALLLHNLVDFSLEVGGVALCAVALCATLELGRHRIQISPLWPCALALLVLLGAAAAARHAPDADEDGAALARLARDPAVSPDEVIERGRAAVLRHPMDSYLSAVVAVRLFQAGHKETLRWANRALLGNPNDIAALRTSALVLHRAGHLSQARWTLRHAIARATYPERRLLYENALAVSPTPAAFLSVLPDDVRYVEEALEVLGAQGAPWRFVRDVARSAEGRGNKIAALWLGQAALGLRDIDEAGRQAEALLALPQVPAFLLANLATLLGEAGRAAEAEVLCLRGLARPGAAGDAVHLTLALALLRERRGALTEARALLDRALSEAPDAEAQIRVHEARGALEDRAGDGASAEAARARAARLR